MNKLKMTAVAASMIAILTGCAQRYVSPEEQAMTNAAYKGAAMQQALQNAHAAAFDGKEIGSSDDGEHKHHKHKHYSDESNDSNDDEQDNGVVYRHGKKGYLNADGDFIQYGQSAHKRHSTKTSCKDLEQFTDQGLELTAQQENELQACLTKNAKSGKGKTWTGYGITVERHADGQVYVDGKPAALDEKADGSTAYSQGVNSIIIYDNGKAALVVNGVVKGYLK